VFGESRATCGNRHDVGIVSTEGRKAMIEVVCDESGE